MKRDQYIPHDVTMRNNSQVINLIEAEGAAGYGFFWAVMEYLRTQDNYVGDLRVIRTLARQMKIQIKKALRILQEYDLFVCDDYAFYSPKLNKSMLPLERKRMEMDVKTQHNSDDSSIKVEQKLDESTSKVVCNSLKINRSYNTIYNKVKESKVSSSSKEDEGEDDGDDDVVLHSSLPIWEKFVNELSKEEQWKELMAMRSGLKENFLKRFDEILQHFKVHIRAVGNERTILSVSDAKRYFCFYITPGCITYQRLMEQLRTSPPKASRYEELDSETGERSYCGILIPPEAPPRPNDQAVWHNGKWVF